MNTAFFSLEMAVRTHWVWCEMDDCIACDDMEQRLYNLSREENR